MGGKGGYQVPDLGGLASASPPYACALGPRLPPRIHLSHAHNPEPASPFSPGRCPQAPLPDPGSPTPAPPSLKLLRTWAG